MPRNLNKNTKASNKDCNDDCMPSMGTKAAADCNDMGMKRNFDIDATMSNQRNKQQPAGNVRKQMGVDSMDNQLGLNLNAAADKTQKGKKSGWNEDM